MCLGWDSGTDGSGYGRGSGRVGLVGVELAREWSWVGWV